MAICARVQVRTPHAGYGTCFLTVGLYIERTRTTDTSIDPRHSDDDA